MNAEFFYKGPVRLFGLRYSGPPWVFLAIVFVLGLVILGVIVAKTLAGF